MRVIALANQKGGVGKTTTAVNLAGGLAQLGHPTILIDCDAQANASTAIGYFESSLADPMAESSYRLFSEDGKVSEIALPTQFPDLSLVPSSKHLSGLEVELVDADGREMRLKNSIDSEPPVAEFLIIDTPPSLGLITLNCLIAADELIIPVQCEFLSLAGVARIMETVRLVQGGPNPLLRVIGIVATMFDTRNNLSKDVVSELSYHYPLLLFSTVIPRSVRMAEAPSYGMPIVEFAPSSSGAEAYMKLTKEVLTR